MEQLIIERLSETSRPLPSWFNQNSFSIDNVFDLIRTFKKESPPGGRPAVLKTLKRLEKRKRVVLNNDKRTWCFKGKI